MVLAVYFTIIGLILGSFATVVISRGPIVWRFVERPTHLPDRYGLAFPRSHCPECMTPIRRLHLIPGIGYALTRGKCASCHAPIPFFYPALEWTGAAFGGVCYLMMPTLAASLFGLLFLMALLTAAIIDARTGYLPDAITLPLIGLGLLISPWMIFVSWPLSLAGALLGYGVFWAISTLYTTLRKQEGLGLGDAKLLAAIGAFCGPYALPFVILIAASSALVTALINSIRTRESLTGATAIRFGPYLAAAGGITLFAQRYIAL